MKTILFYFQILLYIIYTMMIFTTIFPAVKSSIGLTNSKSYPIMAYAVAIIPYLLGCFMVYKSYTNLASGAFWLYFLLSLAIVIILVPISLMFLG